MEFLLMQLKEHGVVATIFAVSGEPPGWNSQSAAFAEGVKAEKPGTTIRYAVIGPAAYSDAAGGKRVTESVIAAGADIIFGQGDGASFGMIEAAETNKATDGGKVWFIDVIGDKSSIEALKGALTRFEWPETRRDIASALARLGDPSGMPILLAGLDHKDDLLRESFFDETGMVGSSVWRISAISVSMRPSRSAKSRRRKLAHCAALHTWPCARGCGLTTKKSMSSSSSRRVWLMYLRCWRTRNSCSSKYSRTIVSLTADTALVGG